MLIFSLHIKHVRKEEIVYVLHETPWKRLQTFFCPQVEVNVNNLCLLNITVQKYTSISSKALLNYTSTHLSVYKVVLYVLLMNWWQVNLVVFAQLPVPTFWPVRQHHRREENRLCTEVVISYVGFKSS